MFRFVIALLSFALIVPIVPVLHAQTANVSAAPLPSQITTAKKVFISNAGVAFDWGKEPTWDGEPTWSGGFARPYNQFYAAIKNWSRYEIVAAPGDADVVFEISVVDPIAGSSCSSNTLCDSFNAPQFKLVLLDPKTHIVLWTLQEHAPMKAIQNDGHKPTDRGQQEVRDMNRKIQQARGKNLDEGIEKLVGNLKALIAQ